MLQMPRRKAVTSTRNTVLAAACGIGLIASACVKEGEERLAECRELKEEALRCVQPKYASFDDCVAAWTSLADDPGQPAAAAGPPATPFSFRLTAAVRHGSRTRLMSIDPCGDRPRPSPRDRVRPVVGR